MSSPTLHKANLGSIKNWLVAGWRVYLRLKGPSTAYAGIFAIIGLVQFAAVIDLGLTPFVIPLAWAFMLVGPAFLCGFLHASRELREGRQPALSDFFAGFRRSPPGLWVLALVDSLFLMIWLTDAGTVYSMYFGAIPDMSLPETLARLAGSEMKKFLLFTSVMAVALAFAVFVVSAFAVPLMFERRMNLPAAVGASVRAVFSNFRVMMLWALILAGSMFAATLFLPAFVVVFPVLSYASEAACREIWPS
ncbi:MAG: DUF2189 domain-containing protein [Pseudomonadota bacterium]